MMDKFRSLIIDQPTAVRIANRPPEWDMIVHLSSDESDVRLGTDSSGSEGDAVSGSGSGWNSEDADDEEEDGDRDGQEPVPGGMELQLPDDIEDEQAAIRAAKAAAHKDGDEGIIRDFALAARIAREDSVAVVPEFTGARDIGYGGRKNAIYEKKLAQFEAQSGRKATPVQIDRLWNEAGLEAWPWGRRRAAVHASGRGAHDASRSRLKINSLLI